MNRNILEQIEKILILSFKGQNKEQISHGITLNKKLLQKYLDVLLELRLLNVSGNPRKDYYQITTRGKAFLNDLKNFQETDNV